MAPLVLALVSCSDSLDRALYAGGRPWCSQKPGREREQCHEAKLPPEECATETETLFGPLPLIPQAWEGPKQPPRIADQTRGVELPGWKSHNTISDVRDAYHQKPDTSDAIDHLRSLAV